MISAWKEEISESDLKRLRRKRIQSPLFLQLLSDGAMVKTIYDIFASEVENKVNLQKLALFPSFCSLYIMSLCSLSLEWLANGFGKDVQEEKHTNDLVDMEFVTFGLCCAAFSSREPRNMNLLSILREASKRLWSRNREDYLQLFKADLEAGN